MPHATLKMAAGVDQNETPTLNATGLSYTNLVRFKFDRNGIGLVEKLGGWSAFYNTPMPAITRALWAWADTNDVPHLAVATQTITGQSSAQLSVITNGSQTIITPQQATTNNINPAASTASGSAVVTITDTTTTGITNYDTVYIQTHVSIGGLILFGLYATSILSSTTYNISTTDLLGNSLAATSTSTSAAVASFSTTNASNVVTVTLANHGFSIGSTYPVLISTTVGGVTLFGNYIVTSVPSTSTFTILATSPATSSATGSINGGHVSYIYDFGVGATVLGTGYGIGGYGVGGYGTGATVTPSLGTPIGAMDWTLDNYGEILIACAIDPQQPNVAQFQPLYQWDPISGNPLATVIPNAPPLNDGAFVAMPQRQIVAWGSTFTGIQDPLLIRWCDVGNFNVWVGQTTNQAGSFRLSRGSRIVAGLQTPQQGLIWTDLDLWSMQYISTPYVYSFQQIGSNCGLISRKACASLNGATYWMGASQFYTLGTDGVAAVACPVWDVIFQNLDQTNLSKIRTAVNSRFGEIAWYYPTLESGGEVAAYVKYNVYLGQWDFGALGRSAWIDQSVLGPPIGADPVSLNIYQHETSPDAAGVAMVSSFQTGFFATSDGDIKTFIDQVWPDMKWGYYDGVQSATVNLVFLVSDYPALVPELFIGSISGNSLTVTTPISGDLSAGQILVSPNVISGTTIVSGSYPNYIVSNSQTVAETTMAATNSQYIRMYGPYPLTQSVNFITPRFRGRLVSIGMYSNDVGSFWRLGAMRYRWMQDGQY